MSTNGLFSFKQHSPVIPISAQLGHNVDYLCQHIVEKIPEPQHALNMTAGEKGNFPHFRGVPMKKSVVGCLHMSIVSWTVDKADMAGQGHGAPAMACDFAFSVTWERKAAGRLRALGVITAVDLGVCVAYEKW